MDVREERLLTIHARECEWLHIYYKVIFKMVHTRTCSFIYKQSEDERRARLDEKIQ